MIEQGPLEAYESIVSGTKEFFVSNGFSKAVLGVSGGIDSALTLRVLVDALGKENVTALILPEKGLTSDKSVEDAENWCEELGVKHYTFNINGILEALGKTEWELNDYTEMNAKARARMIVLYSFANAGNALVVGTGNKSELLLGYFTKFGDGACDILPLGSIFKTQVVEISKKKGLPERIIAKKPTAELTHGQFDEDEIGANYGEIDSILGEYFDSGSSESDLKKKFQAEKVEKILRRAHRNEHKTRVPFIVVV